MLNDSYEPRGEIEEEILDVLKAEGGRLAPSDIYSDLGLNEGAGQHPLNRLQASGYVGRPRHGLYEFNCDPREMSDSELAEMYARHALELDAATATQVVQLRPDASE